jgi:hypothetical protein
MIQLESILKFNCFLSMVYVKRPPKSYGGRKCGHRKISVRTTALEHTCKETKVVPPTRHAGAKGERKYSSYSFLASALDGGEWSASRLGRALPLVPNVQETGQASLLD